MRPISAASIISRVIWLPSFSQSYSFQRLTDIHNLCNESQGVRRLLLQHYGHASFNLSFRHSAAWKWNRICESLSAANELLFMLFFAASFLCDTWIYLRTHARQCFRGRKTLLHCTVYQFSLCGAQSNECMASPLSFHVCLSCRDRAEIILAWSRLPWAVIVPHVPMVHGKDSLLP